MRWISMLIAKKAEILRLASVGGAGGNTKKGRTGLQDRPAELMLDDFFADTLGLRVQVKIIGTASLRVGA